MTPPICPYCQRPSVLLKTSDSVYNGRDYGPIYRCDPCDAHVGCHPGTFKPLGRLANKELRQAKQRAHEAFDPRWKTGKGGKGGRRRQAYAWLAAQLGIPFQECHIGEFDVETCNRVVELCREKADA
jgi:hypothetical protein